MTRQADALPSGSLAVAGGPLGRHVTERAASWLATVVPLLFAASGMIAASVVERSHCVQKGWAGSDQFWHGCFSDLPALYQLGDLHSGLAAYVGGNGAQTDHPVLTGAVMSALGGLVPAGPFLDQTRWYFGLWALLAAALAIAIVYLTAASRPRHVPDAAQVALSPVLMLTALISADLFGVALVSAGIWAWSRRRPVLAGALLGLAVTARTYPLLILLALVVLGLRTGRFDAVRRVLGAAVAAAAVVLLPFLVGNPSAITHPYQVWWKSTAGLGSPWMLPQLLGAPLPVGGVNLVSMVSLALALLAGTVFALSTWRRPTLAEVSLIFVALALVAGKSFPVQSSLWLVPLVALCGVRWRDQLVWAGAEALHFVMVWLYVGGLSKPDRGLPPQWYAVFLVVRLLGVLYLVWRVWQKAASRAEAPQSLEAPEPVGAGGAVDPSPDSDTVVDELAGDFADAPDQLLVRLS